MENPRETHLSHTMGNGHSTSDAELLSHPGHATETRNPLERPSSWVALPRHEEKWQKKTKGPARSKSTTAYISSTAEVTGWSKL